MDFWGAIGQLGGGNQSLDPCAIKSSVSYFLCGVRPFDVTLNCSRRMLLKIGSRRDQFFSRNQGQVFFFWAVGPRLYVRRSYTQLLIDINCLKRGPPDGPRREGQNVPVLGGGCSRERLLLFGSEVERAPPKILFFESWLQDRPTSWHTFSQGKRTTVGRFRRGRDELAYPALGKASNSFRASWTPFCTTWLEEDTAFSHRTGSVHAVGLLLGA